MVQTLQEKIRREAVCEVFGEPYVLSEQFQNTQPRTLTINVSHKETVVMMGVPLAIAQFPRTGRAFATRRPAHMPLRAQTGRSIAHAGSKGDRGGRGDKGIGVIE